MKNSRIVTSVVFAVCAFYLTAQAQTYKADNGVTGGDRVEITIVVTPGPKGYTVSGEYRRPGQPVRVQSCKISGSYFPAGRRLRARCGIEGLPDLEITGEKLKNREAFQIQVPAFTGGHDLFVAIRQGGCDGFAGTWETNVAKLTIEVKGNLATGSYDFDGGELTGKLFAEGAILSGRYTETEAKGTFRFTLGRDGQSFSGRWHRTSGRRQPLTGSWTGKCSQR